MSTRPADVVLTCSRTIVSSRGQRNNLGERRRCVSLCRPSTCRTSRTDCGLRSGQFRALRRRGGDLSRSWVISGIMGSADFVVAHAVPVLGADPQQKTIDRKHGTRSNAHTAESVRRVVPTQHHDRSADRPDDDRTRRGNQRFGEPRRDEECRGSERSHSGDCSRRIRQGRSALEMAADERFRHRLHDQHRRNRSDETRQRSHPVPGQSPCRAEHGRPGDQHRQGTEVSHVGGPSRGQVCGQEPEPDGVNPVWPRSVNEYQPGERCHTEQEAPEEHLHRRLGVMAEERARLEAARRRFRHDHARRGYGPRRPNGRRAVRSLRTNRPPVSTTVRILVRQQGDSAWAAAQRGNRNRCPGTVRVRGCSATTRTGRTGNRSPP